MNICKSEYKFNLIFKFKFILSDFNFRNHILKIKIYNSSIECGSESETTWETNWRNWQDPIWKEWVGQPS